MSFGGAGAQLWGRRKRRRRTRRSSLGSETRRCENQAPHKHHGFVVCFLFHNKTYSGWLSVIQGTHQPWTQGPSSQEVETSPASSHCWLSQNSLARSLLCHGGLFFLAFPTLDQFNSILAVAVIEHSPYPDVFHTGLGGVGLSSSPQASPPAQPLGGI